MLKRARLSARFESDDFDGVELLNDEDDSIEDSSLLSTPSPRKIERVDAFLAKEAACSRTGELPMHTKAYVDAVHFFVIIVFLFIPPNRSSPGESGSTFPCLHLPPS